MNTFTEASAEVVLLKLCLSILEPWVWAEVGSTAYRMPYIPSHATEIADSMLF